MILSRLMPTLRLIASAEMEVCLSSPSLRSLSSLSTIETRMIPLSQNISYLNFSSDPHPLRNYRFLHYSRYTASPERGVPPDPFLRENENQPVPSIRPKITMKDVGAGAAAVIALALGIYGITYKSESIVQTTTPPPPSEGGREPPEGDGGPPSISQIVQVAKPKAKVITSATIVDSITQNYGTVPVKKKA